MRILFTGVGRRIELIQAFREAAMVLKKDLTIYGEDFSATAPALAYCDFVRRVGKIGDPHYIDNLLRLCRDDRIDLIIPTIDTGLLVLSENREKFDAIGAKAMISAPEMVRLCRDKNLISRFFTECGLNAPMPVSDWKRYGGGYPAFIKPKDGSSSIDAFKVENAMELEVYANQIGEYVIQPFVSGTEYTIDIFCDWDGEPVSIVPRERLQVRAGEVLKTRITMDEVMIQEAVTLCRAFRPCGPITVQLIRDYAGTDWFIEINPRFGGGAPLSMKAGARSAEAVLTLLDGERPAYFHDIENGAVYSRFDQSVCVFGGKSGRKIQGIIFDLDDTLYSEKNYVRSGYAAVARYLRDERYAERLWALFEQGRPAISELLKELRKEDALDDTLAVYRSHQPSLRLYDGVADMLREFRERGIKTGIITDGRPAGQRNKIAALGLQGLVDDIIVTDELGGSQFRKPCDVAFRILQIKWQMEPGAMLYVGDNPEKDALPPRQLGMKFLYFQNHDGLYSKRPSSEFETIQDVLHVKNYAP